MEIIRVAESEKADLIVIATHGLTGWRRLAFGSVTDKLVRTAACSVLVLRAEVAASAASAAARSRSSLVIALNHQHAWRNRRIARGARSFHAVACEPDLRIPLLIEYNISR